MIPGVIQRPGIGSNLSIFLYDRKLAVADAVFCFTGLVPLVGGYGCKVGGGGGAGFCPWTLKYISLWRKRL